MVATDLERSTFVAKPNNSLSPQGFIWLFVGIVAITMTVAISVALVGAWFVLPFAGLEILAFACTFHYVLLHYGDYESITLTANEMVVEKCNCKRSERFVFQRYWAKVMLREASDGTCGLFIGSHGKEIEFGRRLMNDEQKLVIAKQLKQQLNN